MIRAGILASLGVGLLVVGRAAAAEAAEPFDPAVRARMVARYLPSDAAGVGYLDVRRLQAGSLFAELTRMAPDNAATIRRVQATTESSLQQFLKAGGREAFLVFTLQQPVLVVPLPAGADEAAILAVLAGAPLATTEKIAGALVAGPEKIVAQLREAAPPARPDLASALAAAGDVTLALVLLPTEDNRKVVEQLLPVLPAEFGGGSTRPVSRGLTWAAVGIDGPPKLAAHAVLQATDAQAARQLAALLDGLFDTALKSPEAQQMFPDLAGLRKLLAPQVKQDRLVFEIDGKQLAEQLQGPVEQARAAAKRLQSANNLKQLALSMHIYHDVHQSFPPAVRAKGDKPLLSWRVLVLPYLEQAPLYNRFHLDEPWDSEHNKPLIAEIPAIFRSPFAAAADPGRTTYLTPRGPGTAFPGRNGVKITDITDGTSQTIMLVETDDEHAVVWTKPEDWEYDAKEPLRGLRKTADQRYLTAFCDGSVRALKPTPEALRAMLTIAGGEVVPND